MKLRGGALGIAISMATAAFVAGCGSSSNSGAGGKDGGTGGKGTGGTMTDASSDVPADVPAADRPGDTAVDAPPPVCGPFADGGTPSDAGVDAASVANFFVTSDTAASANLGGLLAADARCQTLATAVGLGGKTWHAYLSVEHGPGGDAGTGPINAKDRIGPGPYYNVRGALIAQDSAALHSRAGDAALFVDEHGVMINGQWTGSVPPPEHDILTGSNPDGTVAIGKTCADWTSAAGIPDGGVPDGGDPDGGSLYVARVGHTDGLGPRCASIPSWNSAHDTASCADVRSRGGDGRIYCFAIN
jgi:hypothetical protein